MSKELKKLVEKWQEEKGYRDGGAAAKKTWQEIKKIATDKQLIKLLEGSN